MRTKKVLNGHIFSLWTLTFVVLECTGKETYAAPDLLGPTSPLLILAFGMRVRGVLAVPPGSGRSSILGRLREEFRAGARAPGFVFRHGLIRGSTGLYPRSAPGRGSKLIPVEKTKWI